MGIGIDALNRLRTSAEYILGKTTTHRYVVVDVVEWENIVSRAKYERYLKNINKRDPNATFSIDDTNALSTLPRFFILKQEGTVNAYHIEFTPKRALPSIKPINVPLYVGTDIMDSTPTLAIPAVPLWDPLIFTAFRHVDVGLPLGSIENCLFDEMNKSTVEKIVERAKNDFKFQRCSECNRPFAVKRTNPQTIHKCLICTRVKRGEI